MEFEKNSSSDTPDSIGDCELTGITEEHRQHVHKLLAELQQGQSPQGPADTTPESATDSALNGSNFKNFPALRRARAQLAVKACDPKLDVIF